MHAKACMQDLNIIKRNVTMSFYNEKEQLYLETDTSGEGAGTSLLQGRDGMWFLRNEAPDNVALWPLVLARKA